MKISDRSISKRKQKFKKTNLCHKRSAKKTYRYLNCSIRLRILGNSMNRRKERNLMSRKHIKDKFSEKWKIIVSFIKVKVGIQAPKKKIFISRPLSVLIRTCQLKMNHTMNKFQVEMETHLLLKCTELISILRTSVKCILKS